MELTVKEEPANGDSRSARPAAAAADDRTDDARAAELGIWLSGIESFLGTAGYLFADKLGNRMQDWSSELRLTQSAMLRCSDLLAAGDNDPLEQHDLNFNDRDEISSVLRDAIVLNAALLRSSPVSWNDWRSWSRLVSESLRRSAAFERAVRLAERVGDDNVPARLGKMLDERNVRLSDRLDLTRPTRGFSRILLWLSVVERMLANDEPLKPALVIFARVNEETQDIVNYINHRLLRFPDEDSELFRVLDTAAYTASIELRKVFEQEMVGIVTIRSAITIFARIETSCSIMRDAMHQVLTGFATYIDPAIDPADIFSAHQLKLDASIALRRELARMIKLVRQAEHSPEKGVLSPEDLRGFVAGPVQSLFYKDRDSVERFAEEILRSSGRNDLVPILHRFGAFLETLLGHVNNRTILAGHPFEGLTDAA